MGRILFLSAAAFLAYKYISRSNKRHQPALSGENKTVEVLPPAASPMGGASAPRVSAAEPVSRPKLITTTSRAAESDPVR